MDVFDWIFQIAVEGMKYLILGYYFFGYIFNRKRTRYLLALYLLLIPVVGSLGNVHLVWIYKNLWGLFLLLFLFQGSVLGKIKAFFVMWFLISLMDVLVGIPFLVIPGISVQNFAVKIVIECIGCLVWGLLGVMLKGIRAYTREMWKALSFREYVILLGVLILSAVILGGIQGYSYDAISMQGREMVFVLAIIMVIIFLLIVVLLLHTKRSKERLEEINRLNSNYLKLQRKYYEESLKEYDNMRKFRHDIHNHILLLFQLSKEDKIIELKKYIEEMAAGYEEVRGIHTGNFVADCIISHTIKELQKDKDFSFQLDGHFPEKFFMEDIDFCILLSNLLDNAREALEKLQGEKCLWVEVKRYRQWLYLIIRNTTGEERIDFGHSSKPSGYHGYGTQNVKCVVEKYHGQVEWVQLPNVVEVKMIFEENNQIL